MAFGWEGKMVRLVPMDFDRHYENAYRWINDPEISHFLAVGDLPISRLAEKEWFEARQRGSEREVSFAIETLAGDHIGFSGIFNIDYRDGVGYTGTLISPEFWGKGYGTDAARVRTRYAFEVLNLRLLLSEFYEGNERSMKMQHAAGYREYGRIPKRHWKRGQYRDAILTYCDRDSGLWKD